MSDEDAPEPAPAPAEGDDSEPEPIEDVPSEAADREASLHTYEILTYPADYTLEVLVDKWRKGQITIPKFQRRFVWSQIQSSKLIESFLKGLPVPSIFLFSDPETNELLVVDGQQRVKTIAYFFEGYFGDEEDGKRRVFRLTGFEEGSLYEGLTYEDLESVDPAGFAKLNDSVLRAFVIRQLDPADDTSIYHVFERLNTGGTLLQPQEIRNCVHHGPFNDMLTDVNKLETWRSIYGREKLDRRQRDVGLILRFIALLESSADYEKPMKDFLNKFMASRRSPGDHELDRMREFFERTATVIQDELGEKPFHIRAGLNAAVFDCVSVAIAHHLDSIPANLRDRYEALVTDDEFLSRVTSATTDKEIVGRRLAQASEALFGN